METVTKAAATFPEQNMILGCGASKDVVMMEPNDKSRLILKRHEYHRQLLWSL